MAIVKCRECGKEISTSAGACPHCGNPPLAKKVEKAAIDIVKAGLGLMVLIPFILIVIVIIMAAMGDKP